MRLQTTYWCYEAPDTAAVPSPAPIERNGYVTFGCLNTFGKVSRPALETWAKLLAAVTDSRLILHASPGPHVDRARELLGARVEFIGRLPMERYLQTYSRIDIALDPFPCGGGTTTCDALWMGVPVITLAGDVAMRRTGASLLSLIGLTDLITGDTAGYLDAARSLAADSDRLRELRTTLRQRMAASPLMDAPAFARDVERCYRQMWRDSRVAADAHAH